MQSSNPTSRASQRGESRRSSVIWGSISSLRLRFPGWPRISTIRCRHSSCGRSNRLSRISSWMLPTTKSGTEHGTSPKRSWWSPECARMVTGRSWARESPTVRMKNSGRDSSRTSKNEDLPGFNWSSRMGIPASRRRLKPPSSVHPGRCVRFIVPEPS